MNMQQLPLQFSEKIIFSLRSLYNRYGYSQFRMGKFEEYDLYARNKDFLISDSVLTFTDTNGKLMALKPDVTLSIVKNSKDLPDTVQKLYYNENVYRVSKGSRSFREIMQVGLECLGNVDDYCICEVLMLAAESLLCISEESVLDISHMGLLSDFVDSIGISYSTKGALLKCIGEKNLHELEKLCREQGVADENIRLLRQLVSICGTPDTVLPKLRGLLEGKIRTEPLDQLIRVVDAMKEENIQSRLRFDFSVVNDSRYYNGIVFKGYVSGLPSAVLSGGQYDSLMQRMKRRSGAIGFAVYMDVVEQLTQPRRDYDVDAVLLYEEGTPVGELRNCVSQLTRQGRSVLVQRQVPETVKYRQLLKLCHGEVESFENNA